MTTEVFELSELDSTNDQIHTRGMFPSLEDALAIVDKHGVKLCEMNDTMCELQIHRRKMGLFELGKPVWSIRWEYNHERCVGDRWVISDSETV